MAVASASAFQVDDSAGAAQGSSPRRQSPATIHKKNRSKVTNGRILVGIDLRTAAGRRYRDLCRAFENEVGGVLTESDRTIIRQAAALTLKAEAMQVAIVNGEAVDEDQLVRISGAGKRLLATLAKKAKDRKPQRPSLADHLRAKAAEVA